MLCVRITRSAQSSIRSENRQNPVLLQVLRPRWLATRDLVIGRGIPESEMVAIWIPQFIVSLERLCMYSSYLLLLTLQCGLEHLSPKGYCQGPAACYASTVCRTTTLRPE